MRAASSPSRVAPGSSARPCPTCSRSPDIESSGCLAHGSAARDGSTGTRLPERWTRERWRGFMRWFTWLESLSRACGGRAPRRTPSCEAGRRERYSFAARWPSWRSHPRCSFRPLRWGTTGIEATRRSPRTASPAGGSWPRSVDAGRLRRTLPGPSASGPYFSGVAWSCPRKAGRWTPC